LNTDGPGGSPDHRRTAHALSFDVEEYFQVANLRGHFPRDRWDEVPSRLSVGMDRIFGALEHAKASATFFFLGWIAERHPALVRRCLDAGYEVASHGYDHAFLQDLGRTGLEEDLWRTERALAAAEILVQNAHERLSLAEGRYQTGVGSIIEQGDAQLQLTSAQQQRVQAEFNLSTARAALLNALGSQ